MGLCAPRPHQGVPPWTRYTALLGFRKSTGFCVEREGTMWGAAPHPAKGVALGAQYTTLLEFRKSAVFCVEQQERMCCSVPRQRLSDAQAPVNLLTGGFRMIDIGKACFPECDSFRKPLPAAGNMAVTQQNPTLHAEILQTTSQQISRNGGAGESFPCFGVWGRRAPKDSPARGRPSFPETLV